MPGGPSPVELISFISLYGEKDILRNEVCIPLLCAVAPRSIRKVVCSPDMPKMWVAPRGLLCWWLCLRFVLQVTVAASLEWEWCGCCTGSPLSSHLVQGITLPACLWLHTSTAITAGSRKQEATAGGEIKRSCILSECKLHCEAILSQEGLNEKGWEAPFGTLLRIKVLMLWPCLAVWVPCVHLSHTLTWGHCSTEYCLLQKVLQVLGSPWIVRCLSCFMYNSISLPYIRGENILAVLFCY